MLDFPVEPIVFFEGLTSFDLGEDQVVVQGADLVEQVVGPFDLGGEWVTVGSLETPKGDHKKYRSEYLRRKMSDSYGIWPLPWF